MKTRILSKKDDIKQTEALKIINHFRKDSLSGLLIPEELKNHREKTCGFCGKQFHNFPTDHYFEEEFHTSCIEDMLRGRTNQ